ncbi:MAG: hypothetical protein MUP55_01570 [Candidatus Aenigmarchaeota archaeon]|nr:hypothetical protein [Candidatus Aenigmarchaeota archaeon]
MQRRYMIIPFEAKPENFEIVFATTPKKAFEECKSRWKSGVVISRKRLNYFEVDEKGNVSKV